MSSLSLRRPRLTKGREGELLAAALEVLGEVGYEAMSMDEVAARARCSKATLYRRWPGKAQLVTAAIRAARPASLSGVDTGTLRGDLLAVVGRLAADVNPDAALMAAIGHAVLTDEGLARTVRTSLVGPESADLLRLVDRAVARGELPRRPAAAEFLPQMLFHVVASRSLFCESPTDSDYHTRFVDQAILPALRHS